VTPKVHGVFFAIEIATCLGLFLAGVSALGTAEIEQIVALLFEHLKARSDLMGIFYIDMYHRKMVSNTSIPVNQ
jgi:hypothetical protein